MFSLFTVHQIFEEAKFAVKDIKSNYFKSYLFVF